MTFRAILQASAAPVALAHGASRPAEFRAEPEMTYYLVDGQLWYAEPRRVCHNRLIWGAEHKER
jgi:hypothetical protein